jgi:hypothetical protein
VEGGGSEGGLGGCCNSHQLGVCVSWLLPSCWWQTVRCRLCAADTVGMCMDTAIGLCYDPWGGNTMCTKLEVGAEHVAVRLLHPFQAAALCLLHAPQPPPPPAIPARFAPRLEPP